MTEAEGRKEKIQSRTIKGVYGKITIQLGEKEVWEKKGKEMEQELESMEKFLRMRKLKGRAILWEFQKEINFLCVWISDL